MKIQLKRSNVLEGGVAKAPTAEQMEYGELAVNYNTADPTIFIKDSADNIIPIVTTNPIQPPSVTPPSAPENGDIWIDTSECPPVLKIWSDCSGTGEWTEIEGGAPKPISPDASDISGFLSGSGTAVDPFLLSPVTINFGQTSLSDETIVISGQKAGALVVFEDTDAATNGVRFSQSTGVVGTDGVWSGQFTFNDTPASTVADTYTGLIKLFETEIYFKWEVSVEANATIARPSVLAPPNNAGIGGDITYTPRTSAVTSVVGDVLTLTDSKTYNNADGADMLQPISETFSAGQTVTAESTTVFANEPAFSATNYTGNSTTGRSLLTGVNNSDKALVWIKSRLDNDPHFLFDTSSGPENFLSSNTTNALTYRFNSLTAFDSDGFTLGSNGDTNSSTRSYAAWNWRAAPGFFDIQTWTGTGGAATLPHALTTKPGVMLVKALSEDNNWSVYHQEVGADKSLGLNIKQGPTATSDWYNTAPTATEFTVGAENNTAGTEYVGYFFADTTGVIKCGSYTGTGNADGNVLVVDPGFQSSWLLIKRIDANSDWVMYDGKKTYTWVTPNTSDPETTDTKSAILGVNGITFMGTDGRENAAGGEYVYVTIAKDAVAPPSAATGTVASAIDNILTLTDVNGTWSPGDFAVNDEEVTKNAPGADVLEFVGSTPQDVPADSVDTWGDATWQVSTDVGFTSPMVGTKLITNSDIPQTLDEDERGAIVLADDTQYWARVKYDATSPAVASSYSAAVTFKTASIQSNLDPGWTQVDFTTSNFTYRGGATLPSSFYSGGRCNGVSATPVKTGYGQIFYDNTANKDYYGYSEDGKSWELLELQTAVGGLDKTDDYCISTNSPLFVDGDTIVMPTKFGFVNTENLIALYSTDAGETWQKLQLPKAVSDVITERTAFWFIYNNTYRVITEQDVYEFTNKTLDASNFNYIQNQGAQFLNGVATTTVNELGTLWSGNTTANSGVTDQLAKSTDGGLTWSAINTTSSFDQPRMVKYIPDFHGSPVVLAGGYNSGTTTLLKIDPSTDSQIVLTTVADLRPATASVNPINNNVLIAGYGQTNSSSCMTWLNLNDTNETTWSLETVDSTVRITNTSHNSKGESLITCTSGRRFYVSPNDGQGNTTYYSTSDNKDINSGQLSLRYGTDSSTASDLTLNKLGITRLTNQPTYDVAGYVPEGDKYRPIEDQTGTVNRLNSELTAAQAKVTDLETRVLSRISALEVATGNTDSDTPLAINGYYPLYTTEAASDAAGDGTSHTHEFDGVTYYMPNGVTYYHGNYGSY